MRLVISSLLLVCVSVCLSGGVRAGTPADEGPLERPLSAADKEVVRRFHQLFRERGAHISSWMGFKTVQYPMDNWIVATLIHEVRPDLIVETGTARGGSTLFYAMVLAQVNPTGHVVTIDVAEHKSRKARAQPLWKERITFIEGSSTAAAVVERVTRMAEGKRVLLLLDSLHRHEHVAEELRLYAPLVAEGGYIVVEDTQFGGPRRAVEEFLAGSRDFAVERRWERYLISQYSGGILRRVR